MNCSKLVHELQYGICVHFVLQNSQHNTMSTAMQITGQQLLPVCMNSWLAVPTDAAGVMIAAQAK
jgi:hypothetical protein